MAAGAGNIRSTLTLLLLAAFVAAHAAPARAQSLQGESSIMVAFVTDSSGKPLSGAEVQVLGTSLRGSTDGDGRVALLAVPSGKAVLKVRHIGYAELTIPISVTPGAMAEARYRMMPIATDLGKVMVRARELVPARYAGTTRFDSFYRRRAEGNGTFLTREIIDERRAQKSEDLLRLVSGIRITYRGATPLINFARCNQVNVYIDGIRSHDSYRDLLGLSPLEIEAMEVYHGIATVPPEFSTHPNDCAAIVVWTRWHGKGNGQE